MYIRKYKIYFNRNDLFLVVRRLLPSLGHIFTQFGEISTGYILNRLVFNLSKFVSVSCATAAYDVSTV